MPDEPNTTPATPASPPPQPNEPTARTPDGTLKDAQATTLDQSSSTPAKSDTTEAKPDAKDATLAAKDGDKKPDAAPQVPDKYEFKAPEGYEVDPAFVEKATPVLKELGISAEGAQKLFDVVQDKIINAQGEMIEAYETMRDGWRKELSTDKDLGNGKDDLAPAVRQNISAAISALPEAMQSAFKDAMNLTGAGDNPAFVRALNFFGQQFREGTPVRGGKPSPAGQTAPGAAPKSAAAAIYPNLPSSSGA